METDADKCRRLNHRICSEPNCGKKLKPNEPRTCKDCFEKAMMDAEKN